MVEAIATAAGKNTDNTAQIQPLQLTGIRILEVKKFLINL